MERLFLGSQAGDTCLAKLSARAVSRSAAAAGAGWAGRVWIREVPTGSLGHEGGGAAHRQGGHSFLSVNVRSPMDSARRILGVTSPSLPGSRAGRVHCQDRTAGGGSAAQGGRGGAVATPGESDPRDPA